MTGEETAQLFERPYPDSELPASLRQFLEIYPALQNLARPLAQFTLVIDANIAVQDLTHKHRPPLALCLTAHSRIHLPTTTGICQQPLEIQGAMCHIDYGGFVGDGIAFFYACFPAARKSGITLNPYRVIPLDVFWRKRNCMT